MPIDGMPFRVAGVEGIQWRALAVASKPAPYSPNREHPVAGDNVALVLRDAAAGSSLVYAPGLGTMEESVWHAMCSSALRAGRRHVLDGRRNDHTRHVAEARPRYRSPAAKRPRRHARVARAAAAETRRILIHVNNTNPILDEDSPERAQLNASASRSPATAWRFSCEPGAWTRAEFERQLRERGRAYHIHHPFNVMLNTGKATPVQIRGWVANRYYYQINIPVKDAAILANCEEREVRRNWVQRIR